MPATVDSLHFTDRPHDRTVGVMGGMGPLATVDFFGLLVRMTPADKDWNHLHIIIDNNPRIPSRSRALLFDEESPVPYLIAGAKRLVAMGAQLIVVPCNSASHFLAPVRAAVGVPVLDPVLATAAALRAAQTSQPSQRWPRSRRPLVLGGMVTHRAELYGKALADTEGERAIRPMRPSEAEQSEVAALIEALKRGETGPALIARTLTVIEAGAARGADGAILGCTEFGLIAEALAEELAARTGALPLFNSNELLARQALALALARPIQRYPAIPNDAQR
jgi:aspartate racemase